MNPLVFAIVLNFNHRAELSDTLQSLLRQDYPDLRIIVADNGSTDDSVEWIRKNHPGITLIENRENLGWSGGNNAGLRYALANGADLVLFSNNDVWFDDPSIISGMTETLTRHEDKRVAITGVRVNYFEEPARNHNEGWIMYPKQAKRGHPFNRHRPAGESEIEPGLRSVDSADGSFFMVNAKLFGSSGYFDESYFLYADEIEFSLRAWKEKYASVVNTRFTVLHRLGTSSGRFSPLSAYYRTRNRWFLIRDFNPSLLFRLIYIRDWLKGILLAALHTDPSGPGRCNVIKAMILGFTHAILGKTGKRW